MFSRIILLSIFVLGTQAAQAQMNKFATVIEEYNKSVQTGEYSLIDIRSCKSSVKKRIGASSQMGADYEMNVSLEYRKCHKVNLYPAKKMRFIVAWEEVNKEKVVGTDYVAAKDYSVKRFDVGNLYFKDLSREEVVEKLSNFKPNSDEQLTRMQNTRGYYNPMVEKEQLESDLRTHDAVSVFMDECEVFRRDLVNNSDPDIKCESESEGKSDK
ncbi:MAG: hypothetical protein H6621_05060 [Halobacteriovoraceae bacterium]|nr:hypothetical protein [Halobacteriovoraceae bacterium]